MPARERHAPDRPEPGKAGAARTYLSFLLGDDLYAVDLGWVRGIRGPGATTRLPGAPAPVRGLMSLDGTVVPVIDLGRCLGRPCVPLTASTVLVVLALGERLAAGMVTDVVGTFVHRSPGRTVGPAPVVLHVESLMAAAGLSEPNDVGGQK